MNLVDAIRDARAGKARSVQVKCPAHDDGDPSLSVTLGQGGKILLKCHAHCPTESVVAAAGLSMGDLFPNPIQTTAHWKPSPEYLARQRREAEAEILRKRAVASKEKILREYAIEPAELCRQSPTNLVGVPDIDLWRWLLRLFQPDDVLWIGDLRDSGPGHEGSFRTAQEWLTLPQCPGPRICPNTFQPGANSRGKDSILDRVFLVIESDKLTLKDQCAVIQYVRKYCRLRAVIHSGNRSLHAWFQHPPEVCLKQLEIILPEIGIDPAGFNPSQPYRMPGVQNLKSGRFSDLVFLDVEGDE